MTQSADTSPRPRGRLTGLVYLTFLATSFATAVFPRSAILASTNAAAAASQIMAAEPMYRLSVTAEVVSTAIYVALTLLLYELLKPAGRSLALLAAFFSLVGCAVTAANEINLFAPLVLLGGGLHASASQADQMQALALIALKMYGKGYTVTLVFFGVFDFLLGCLILRSAFLPRILGAVLVAAGLLWLAGTFAAFLSPQVAKALSPLVMGAGIVSEGALALWLTFAGVNSANWLAQAERARA